jgi:hypothetical protein
VMNADGSGTEDLFAGGQQTEFVAP